MAKIKICLDAGHYGKINRSPVVKEYYESDMNWKLHLLLKKYLEEYGVEVVQTRSKQATDLGLIARGNKAKGCDLFLSIHSNACDTESVDRPVVIVPLDGKSDALGKKLGDCIASTMGTKQKMQLYKRESNGREWYGVIRGAVAVGVPGLILEHSFHTNTAAAKWLLNDSNLDKLAKAEADVLAAHYGLKKSEAEAETASGNESAVNVGLSVLKKGAKGEQVKAVQRMLYSMGYDLGTSKVDGDFGSKTDAAVRAYQKKKGLTVDGIVGQKTWLKLLKG